MHFRIRKNVIQLIRVSYDQNEKKGKNTVVGTVRLANPELTDEMRRDLTSDEVAAFELWLQTQHHTTALREELAALSLGETMEHAGNWFRQQGNSTAARAAVAEIYPQWQALRRIFQKNGLLD